MELQVGQQPGTRRGFPWERAGQPESKEETAPKRVSYGRKGIWKMMKTIKTACPGNLCKWECASKNKAEEGRSERREEGEEWEERVAKGR